MTLLPAAPRVLVVGGGPVGLATGVLLERLYGVSARVVERQARPTTHPQAHFLNLRSMEVLYATMPAFHDRLLALAAPSRLWRDYVYCTGGGKRREFARVDQFGPCIAREPGAAPEDRDALRDALAALSPSQFLHFPQNRFEELLNDFAAESGVRVDRGVELVGVEPAASDREPTHVSLRHLASNDLERAEFDYVVAADGAHSAVRRLCGIDMAGATNLQTIANVHFTSRSLSEAARENPAMLYFVFNPDVIGVLIAHDLAKGEWVFQIPFFPPQESLARDFSEAQCRALVAAILPAGRAAAADDVSILSVGQWRMGARVASRYAVHRRVFLAGDAAHQFPPAGGFGMNTGLQDAHNLAWKLALAVQAERRGDADVATQATLLDSYQRERQLVAKINTQFALRNVARTMKVPAALNVSHDNAKLLAALANSPPLRLLPLSAQRALVQRAMRLGKLPLGLLDAASGASALGDHMRTKVREIVAHRRSLGMLFYHFDIGFSYDTAAWAARAKQLMQEPALDQAALFRARVSTAGAPSADMVFSPAVAQGARFPHLWLEDTRDGTRLSTLDLPSRAALRPENADKSVQFVLVADADAADVSDIGACIPHGIDARNVSLALVTAGDGPAEADAAASVFRSVLSLRVGDDEASADGWRAFLSENTAALIRPDGHVAALWPRVS